MAYSGSVVLNYSINVLIILIKNVAENHLAVPCLLWVAGAVKLLQITSVSLSQASFSAL